MTGERIDPALIDLVPPLRALVPPATVVDKSHYSPFTEQMLPICCASDAPTRW